MAALRETFSTSRVYLISSSSVNASFVSVVLVMSDLTLYDLFSSSSSLPIRSFARSFAFCSCLISCLSFSFNSSS